MSGAKDVGRQAVERLVTAAMGYAGGALTNVELARVASEAAGQLRPAHKTTYGIAARVLTCE